MELSKLIAKYVVRTKYEDLPEEVVNFTKHCILDYFASAIAGSNQAPIQMLKEFVVEQGGAEQATLVTGGKTSVTHAATVVIPAALALAEWKK
ncbi:MmgE/PrpD family protein [Psychrobacillus sp. OK032]|uniref:MmgE/PrpD family protein n=1 Tax=Psychrobacillus sp. OK032 TaxID=1884358 RepID=UPI0008C2DCE1|nr:MmgE/PrpD family protein [Psychrobacillus sp. OK032]SES46543.1 2-methylcitrate dehydratase [Psychrobacillus sp. OK032]